MSHYKLCGIVPCPGDYGFILPVFIHKNMKGFFLEVLHIKEPDRIQEFTKVDETMFNTGEIKVLNNSDELPEIAAGDKAVFAYQVLMNGRRSCYLGNREDIFAIANQLVANGTITDKYAVAEIKEVLAELTPAERLKWLTPKKAIIVNPARNVSAAAVVAAMAQYQEGNSQLFSIDSN